MELHDRQSQFETWSADNHSGQDAARDIFHFRHVWMTTQKLGTGAPVDWLVTPTTCYFHDLINLPKNHPEHHHSSVLAALETRHVLMRDFPDFPRQRLLAVCHTIETHGFSAGIAPETLKAKIVQDADRLKTPGAIGLACVFTVSGALGISLFNAEGPFTRKRSLDDKQYTLNHFQTKLLTLPLTVQTERERHLTQHNADFLLTYMTKLNVELKGEYEMLDLDVIQPFKAR